MNHEYDTDAVVILCSVAETSDAHRIAEHLVNAHLAACVSITPKAVSVYRWQDKVEQAQEHNLVIKTSGAARDRCIEAIRSLHPYEVPEIIAVPIVAGLADYIDWIKAETNSR